MKNAKLKISAFLSFLILIYSIQPVLAANQYSVKSGAQFRWDASYYFFDKDSVSYTLSYYFEFDFTNWAGTSGAEYLNGTVNNNGTIYDGEISHDLYYGGMTFGQEWVTAIIDYNGPYPVHVYLVCNTEIDQTTKPQMQNLADNSFLSFGETPTNNFSLTGTDIAGDITNTYTGNIKFNSDKVLSYVFDEMVTKDLGVLEYVERYIWTLTYTPGTGAEPGNGSSIPGFQLIFIIGAMTVGFIFIHKKTR